MYEPLRIAIRFLALRDLKLAASYVPMTKPPRVIRKVRQYTRNEELLNTQFAANTALETNASIVSSQRSGTCRIHDRRTNRYT